MAEQLTLFPDPQPEPALEPEPEAAIADRIDGEIILPHRAREMESQAFKRVIGDAFRVSFDRMSTARYVAVFGAVPDKPPYRQWLTVKKDTYKHIADVWQDRDCRERLLARLQCDRRAHNLYNYLLRDLAYLDEFAAQLPMERTPPARIEQRAGLVNSKEPAPAPEPQPEAAPKETKRRMRFLALDDPERPRNRKKARA